MIYIDEKNYVDKAEEAILILKNKKNQRTGKPEGMVTTSKIRNLLAISADIYNEVLQYKEEKLNSELVGRIQYLRVRFLYEAGRERKVKEFVEAAHLLDVLKSIGDSKKDYILFNRYMEALIAYHKYHGGQD